MLQPDPPYLMIKLLQVDVACYANNSTVCDGVGDLLTSYKSYGEKQFMSGVNPIPNYLDRYQDKNDLFLTDQDELMSINGVKTLPGVKFQKLVEGSPLFDPSQGQVTPQLEQKCDVSKNSKS